MLRNSSTHYGAIARLFHWSMALLIIVSIAAVELHELFPKGSSMRNGMMMAHFQIGLLVFLLIWLRLAAVFTDKVPPITPAPPKLQNVAAKLVHLALYAAMIALPVLGVLMTQAGDHTLAFLGVAQLPSFIGVDKDLSKQLHEVHEVVGNVMIGLIVAHVAAAIWHHHKQRDDTLLRMLPPRRRG
ncbi:MAG: cytochrome B [Sideroxydans sp.]|nr:cytochrome B [Sideroxydans sp.]